MDKWSMFARESLARTMFAKWTLFARVKNHEQVITSDQFAEFYLFSGWFKKLYFFPSLPSGFLVCLRTLNHS